MKFPSDIFFNIIIILLERTPDRMYPWQLAFCPLYVQGKPIPIIVFIIKLSYFPLSYNNFATKPSTLCCICPCIRWINSNKNDIYEKEIFEFKTVLPYDKQRLLVKAYFSQ